MSDQLERIRRALGGAYEIVRELGAGGMAVVYLARDLKHDREVALKVFRPEVASSVGAERFLREIQIVAKLNHPHILPLYDSGQAGDVLYYVMPLVEDESLAERIEREGQLPLEEAIRIATEVAGALGYAHGQGLVHRDIKPGNIMLSRGHAVVMDFGISTALDVAGADKLTQTGTTVGTPAYMAPEQWDGSGEVDGRLDIYALACTLYEMLLGQPPFSGTTRAVIMARHSLDAVPRPSVQRQTVDPYLESVILKALEKVPADRYQTAEEFAEALQRRTLVTQGVLTAETVVGGGGWGRRGLAVVSTLLTVAAVGLAFWWFDAPSLSGIRGGGAGGSGAGVGGELPARRIAVLYFEDVSPDSSLAYLADGLTDALIDELSVVPALDVVSRNGVLAFRGADLPHDSIASALQAGTVVSGTVGRSGDRIRVNVVLADGQSGADFRRGSFERPSDDLFGIQSELGQEVALLLREWLGAEIALRSGQRGTTSVAAWALVQRGERERRAAEARLEEGDIGGVVTALNTADSLLAEAGTEDPTWARPPALRAQVARRWAQLSAAEPLEAEEWIERGMGHVQRALAIDATDAESLEVRGMLRYLTWALSLESDAAEAATMLSRAEEDLAEAVRYDPTRANAWNVLSIIHSQEPDLVDAKLAALRAYEEDAYLRAADEVLWRLYSTSYDLEQFPDAVQYCDEGRRRFPSDPRFVECRLWLLAAPAQPPDVEQAWELLARLEELSPPRARERTVLRGRILVGGVLGRAGLPDSANTVFMSARAGPQVDPGQELLGLEAVFRIQMGEEDEGIELIKRYLTTSPEHRAGWRWTSHWWWRDVRDHPEFRQVMGTGP